MVLGYMCPKHGFKRNCDVSESGERLCPACSTEVTGVTGSTRDIYASPPEDEPGAMSGDISWDVSARGKSFRVSAFDYVDAIQQAEDEVDDPQEISSVTPSNSRYRTHG